MAEFEEQWWSFAASLSTANEESGTYHNIAHDIYLHDIGTFEESPDAERSVTAVDNVSDTFEFVDFDSAAQDLINSPSPRVELCVPSPATSATLFSPPAPEIVISNGDPYHDQLEVSAAAPPEVRFQPNQAMLNIQSRSPVAARLAPREFFHTTTTSSTEKKKRSLPDNPVEGCGVEPDSIQNTTKKRRKATQEERDNYNKVRMHGACLRCSIQKLQCSESRPCGTCLRQCTGSRSTKLFRWTFCVSSNLPDLNIFALGIKLPHGIDADTRSESAQQNLNVDTAVQLYKLIVGCKLFADSLPKLDVPYNRVLRYAYGGRFKEVHPFILSEVNPLYTLIQNNVILMGSPVISVEIIGMVRYMQTLRAICAVVVFTSLGRALNRTSLDNSGLHRSIALILQIALLLDQVVELGGHIPAAAVACARSNIFEEMRQHLIEFLSYYLYKLTSSMFNGPNPLLSCIESARQRGHVGDSFWMILSNLMPCVPLQKPPMVRRYTDMSWDHCVGEDGEALHELFSSKCSISCR